jgi:peroxin-5
MPHETALQLPHHRPASASPTWAPSVPGMEAAFKPPPVAAAGFSSQEFAHFNASRVHGPTVAAAPMSHANTMMGPSPSIGMGMGMGMGMARQMGGPYMTGPVPMSLPSAMSAEALRPTLDRARVVELDDEKWEEHFKQIDLIDREQRAQEKGKGNETEAAEWTDIGEQNHGDFESIWRALKDEQDTAKKLRSELDQTTDDLVDDWQNFDQSWTGSSAWDQDPFRHEQYIYETENVYEKHPNPFEEGMRIMREGGNLSLAALAFEAAVQREPGHVEAWVQLGSAQAQNEKETAAIRALKKAVSLEPKNLAALMGLAVSYTNEGFEVQALTTLERWLNSKYPDILPDSELTRAGNEPRRGDLNASYARITQYFIRAAQLSPDGEHMDPDVQVGLGVLFYSQEQYDKAVDCFQAALRSAELGTSTQREQVHLLWNRLGATLANSGKPEEAIGAYQQALHLRPHFVRARYNLGVSCIAMKLLDQAAVHLLAGLALHREIERTARDKVAELVGGDPSSVDVEEQLARMHTNRSDTLVDTLRRVFLQMGRKDLAEKCEIDVDPETFRGQFQF